MAVKDVTPYIPQVRDRERGAGVAAQFALPGFGNALTALVGQVGQKCLVGIWYDRHHKAIVCANR